MKGQRKRKSFAAACVLMVLLPLFSFPAQAEEKAPRTVRVGCSLSTGYHRRESDGALSGYGYDYEQLLAQYAGWKIEYVEGSWGQLQEMLACGRIDLLGFWVKNEEREQRFDFSAIPAGESMSCLITRKGAGQLSYQDYASFDGAAVAYQENNANVPLFLNYSVEEIPCGTYRQAYDALESGRADAALMTNFQDLSSYAVVDQLLNVNFYYAVAQGNQELLKELDQALLDVNTFYSNFAETLYDKYYDAQNGRNGVFTKEEREYLGTAPVVAVAPGGRGRPFEYREEKTGVWRGIVPDLLEEISKLTGIEFQYIEDEERWSALQNASRANTITSLTSDIAWAVQNDLDVTQPFIEGSVSVITKDPAAPVKTIAAIKDDYLRQMLERQQPEWSIVYYASQEDCVAAVWRGECDATIMNGYEADYYLSKGRYMRLQDNTFAGLRQGVCFGVGKNSDQQLVRILSKTLRMIPAETLDGILRKNIVYPAQHTLEELLYAKPLQAVLVSMAAVALILLTISLGVYSVFMRRKNQEVLAATRSKSEFLSRMSHDIRTPMNTITNLTRMIEEELDDKEAVRRDLEKINTGLEIVYYDTGEECVSAVKEGRQDAAYLYTYVAEKAIEDDITHRLVSTLVPDFTTNFCVGVGDTGDAVLFSILNKSVASVDKLWLDQLTMAYTENRAGTFSLLEELYNHPVAAVVAVAVILMLVGGAVLLAFRHRAQVRDREQAREIQRLFGYVCHANESVMEVCLQTMRSKEFYFKDNVLCVDEHPYRTAENAEGFMRQEDYASVADRITEETLDELIRDGKEMVFEARGRGKDGVYRWYIYTIHGMKPDERHPRNFMLFKRNINELKVKEEENRKALTDALRVAKEASEAKGSFMSRMSHEIRTPLNAVIGYLTLMGDCLEEPVKVEDYIQKCQSAARHLLNIINDVLDISAIESGKIKIAAEKFDLKELLSTVSLLFYSQAKEKGIDFKVEILDVTEEMVEGDQLRLNQILMNLLSNAMKFTPSPGRVRLTVAQLQGGGDQVRFRFEVADTGIGMSREFMARIFNPFEQEKAETARKYGGSGLGLSITNNLVTMMHGSIQVDSTEGEGTTFTVTLAFGKVKAGEGRSSGVCDFSKLRALIVDDESRSCDYMKALLKRCRVKSDVALSGEAAIRQIMKRDGTDYEYDLCLIDWNMPGLNGVETAERIRQECKKDMPIIIASAYDISEIRDAAIKAGVNRLIAKPLFQSSMFDLLVDTFGKYDPAQGAEHLDQKADFSGVRVLLAEDNAMNLEIAVSILQKSDFVIDTAVNGKEALDKFTASQPGAYQVILMDIQMPVMDGHESARAIRASGHPQAKEIPIIAMTANAFTEDVTAALASGMNDHISKPINYDKLYYLLKKYLQKPEEE
ncbi:MAG: transporter substrate-binding domain-containing protein [Oscillospiraceae bacterium]|nr:transporter substrate-binding domain-containing protein [Oscillospiraceae bacterium]